MPWGDEKYITIKPKNRQDKEPLEDMGINMRKLLKWVVSE
jgi:hypothetical protein